RVLRLVQVNGCVGRTVHDDVVPDDPADVLRRARSFFADAVRRGASAAERQAHADAAGVPPFAHDQIALENAVLRIPFKEGAVADALRPVSAPNLGEVGDEVAADDPSPSADHVDEGDDAGFD